MHSKFKVERGLACGLSHYGFQPVPRCVTNNSCIVQWEIAIMKCIKQEILCHNSSGAGRVSRSDPPVMRGGRRKEKRDGEREREREVGRIREATHGDT